jgi:ubiquinone/menaquinone biosynthesis C-methylase UbiE
MKTALSQATLKHVYARLARHYDLQHGLITARTDQRGRRLLVERLVQPGDKVLDCGSGTGRTGILAAHKVGDHGHVTLFDLSADMLAVAREKVMAAGVQDIVDMQSGDLQQLPFADNDFDVVLSTYSLCPVADPALGARELYRVTRPGGMIGIAHSTHPRNPLVRWLADRVENIAWHLPWLSMGCRAVHVRQALAAAGGKIRFEQHIGVPLWPFLVLIVEKPLAATSR